MPRPRKYLDAYNDGRLPVPVSYPGIGEHRIYVKQSQFAQRYPLIQAASEFLKRYHAQTWTLIDGNRSERDIMHRVVFRDVIDAVLHPDKFKADSHAVKRYQVLAEKHPGFTVNLLKHLREIAKKKPDGATRTIIALRTKSTIKDSYGKDIPIADAGFKEIAACVNVKDETAKKARQSLAEIDSIWPPSLRNLPAKRSSKGR